MWQHPEPVLTHGSLKNITWRILRMKFIQVYFLIFLSFIGSANSYTGVESGLTLDHGEMSQSPLVC